MASRDRAEREKAEAIRARKDGPAPSRRICVPNSNRKEKKGKASPE